MLVCSDELNHASIIDGCRLEPRRRRGLPPPRPRPPRRAARASAATARAIVVSDTVFSMDGDAADVDALRRRRAPARRAARARRSPRGARPARRTFAADADVLRVGTLSKTLGSLGGFVAGPARYVELVENTARPYIFTTAPTPADTAAALAALARAAQSAEGDALVARLRAHVDRLRPGHPSPILPFVCGEEAPRARRGRRAARARPARARDPAADGRAGHVAAARHALGRAHRRHRSTRLAARRSPSVVRRTLADRGDRPRRRHRHRVGKTWVTAAAAVALRGRGIVGARPQARAVVRARRHATPTRDVLAAATGNDPDAVCPPAPLVRVPMAPPMAADALGPTAVHRSPTSSPSCRADDADVVLVESAGGVRSPLADRRRHRRPSPTRARPRSSCSSPTPGWARSTLVRLSVDALARHRVGRVPQPLRPRRRPAPPQPRLARDARGPRGRHRPRGPRGFR